MQKKTKWLTVVIVAAVLCVCLLGYVCVQSGLLGAGDSFYPSDIVAEDFTDGASENSAKSAEPEGNETGKIEKSLEVMNLSKEDFEVLQKEVSVQDKMAVMKLLSKNLSVKDYAELAGMIGGGVEPDEVKKAYQIISRGLSSEDKDVLWGYYDKYKHLIQ